MKFLLIILFSSHAYADGWLCEETASVRENNVFYACGVGEGSSEDMARRYSLKNAASEFTTICELSADCDMKNVLAEPKRTSCKETAGIWKCTRMIQFTLGK